MRWASDESLASDMEELPEADGNNKGGKMGEARFGNRIVKKIEDKGAYRELLTVDGKAKTRKERINRDLYDAVPVPGAYRFGYVLDAESGYPVIVEIQPLDGDAAPLNANVEHEAGLSLGKLEASIREASGLSQRSSETSRAILVQVCIKAAAEVYHGQPKEATTCEPMAVVLAVVLMAQALLEWAEKKLALVP